MALINLITQFKTYSNVSKSGFMVSGNPNVSVKNLCVGILHILQEKKGAAMRKKDESGENQNKLILCIQLVYCCFLRLYIYIHLLNTHANTATIFQISALFNLHARSPRLLLSIKFYFHLCQFRWSYQPRES